MGSNKKSIVRIFTPYLMSQEETTVQQLMRSLTRTPMVTSSLEDTRRIQLSLATLVTLPRSPLFSFSNLTWQKSGVKSLTHPYSKESHQLYSIQTTHWLQQRLTAILRDGLSMSSMQLMVQRLLILIRLVLFTYKEMFMSKVCFLLANT